MKRLENEFMIPFVGLKLGKHQFEYKINKTFFEAFNYDDFIDADVTITLDFEKASTLFDLNFTAKGYFNLACDLTNEPYNQPIEAQLNLVVKFGPEFNNENESILILPYQAYEIDISQYIYEMLVLAIPAKRVHPGIADGTLKSDILDKLKELQPKQISLDEEQVDPRWSKLQTLRTKKQE
jgi:uncharacterized metal-binding protein YceD (DUF177 family)